MNTSVVILAAGLGTRMRSKRAKVLHRAGGLALVEHVVRASRGIAQSGKTVVVTGHQAEDVEKLLSGRGLEFVRQSNPRGGTGQAVALSRPLLENAGGFLMVLYGDVPLLSAQTLERLRDVQAESGAAATLITTTLEDPTGYGRVIVNERGEVTAIVEQKACTPEQHAVRVINSGIYCFKADLFWKHAGEIQPNPASGELYLTDMAEILTSHGHAVRAFHVEDPSELLGINTRIELAEADRILRQRKCRELMLAGVTIEQPETVAIDVDVRVGADTVLEPFVRLLGATEIADDCIVGAGSILDSAVLESGCTVFPYSSITQSRIASGAQIGPFARLRAGSDVGANAQVGNFIELKKTRVGRGAKSHHVGYLGDTTIGEDVNIGAGTIVCNYDGQVKHETRIGRGAFVGSNSTLVAPVEIGEESYVAAGSTVTEAVPPGSLALGRARQVNKPEWARKRKQRKAGSEHA